MLLEMHIIQNFAPANLNRDDSGMPKDCEFGGFRRARISSQCLKSNIRKSKAFTERVEAGVRTRRAVIIAAELLKNEFEKNEDEAIIIAKSVIKAVTKKIDENENKSQYLYYTDKEELRAIIQLFLKSYDNIREHIDVLRNPDSKANALKESEKAIDVATENSLKEYLKLNAHKINSIDIALFGRMLADQPTMKIDAACQVAHAISTNKVSMDFDYFTAIDDLNPDDETGAGMIGNIGFNSSCFYRYASLDVNKLMDNIGNKKEQTISGILGFVEGSIEAIPTGKQNSFAANNPPSYILITAARKSTPISLANAFEKPMIPKSGLSLTEISIQNMLIYFENIIALYDLNYDKIFECGFKVDKDGKVQTIGSIKQLINEIETYLNQNI